MLWSSRAGYRYRAPFLPCSLNRLLGVEGTADTLDFMLQITCQSKSCLWHDGVLAQPWTSQSLLLLSCLLLCGTAHGREAERQAGVGLGFQISPVHIPIQSYPEQFPCSRAQHHCGTCSTSQHLHWPKSTSLSWAKICLHYFHPLVLFLLSGTRKQKYNSSSAGFTSYS